MSTIDLTVLGLLLNKPMNAHEVVKFVDDFGIAKMVKISTPAIYKSCKRLYKAGRLDGKVVREGEAPQKIIYTVNDEGREYFFTLMGNYSSKINPFFLDFNSVLWNIQLLPKEQGVELLESLRLQIDGTKIWLIEHEKEKHSDSSKSSFSARSIVKQYRMVFETLSTWIDETINEFQNQ